MNGKEHMNGDSRLPAKHPEIGQADVANVIDWNVDSDEEFFLEDDDDGDSSDEMEHLHLVPNQAVQYLLNAPQQVENAMAAEQNLAVILDDEVQGVQPADDEVSTDENQEIMEAMSGSESESEESHADAHDLMELVEELFQDVEEQLNILAGNQLNQEQNLAQHADPPHSLVEDQELNSGENASQESDPDDQKRISELAQEMLGKVEQWSVPAGNQLNQEQNLAQHAEPPRSLVEDQGKEMNSGASTSGKGQELNGSSSASGQGQELNGSSSASGQGQELNGSSSASGQGQELNGRSTCARVDQEYEMNGGPSGSSEDPIDEQVGKGGLADCEEAMERLEVEVRPDIQVQPIRGVEVQENIVDQIEVNKQDIEEEDSRKKDILHEELNGQTGSGEPPENQQEKVFEMDANEEAVLEPEPVPDPVQEHVQEVIAANLNEDFVLDEQDNLVEEIEHEEQVVAAREEPAGAIEAGDNVVPQGELAGAIVTQDNVIEEDSNAEVIFDPFIHMA